MADPNPNEARRRWFEPASAILMALTTLCTVWCSYQSSEWNAESGGFATKAARLEQKAASLADQFFLRGRTLSLRRRADANAPGRLTLRSTKDIGSTTKVP